MDARDLLYTVQGAPGLPAGVRMTAAEPLRCLQHGTDCAGTVEYRMPLSATGNSYPRCEAHWSQRLDEHERISRDYPDSPIAPSWFDESAAGERWDEDY